MTRMDCSEVRELLQPFDDGELPPEEAAAVVRHVDVCEKCRAALDDLRALRQRLHAAGTHGTPPGLEARVRRAIGLERAAVGGARWQRSAAVAASHAAALALGGVLAFVYLDHREAREDTVREVVTAHVRALVSDQPVQVASADRHTVKPWFMGRMPFSPPVQDLGPDGYPLIGGRVDVIHDHRAAALVYGRRSHRISLFVLPATQAPGLGEIVASRLGYNVVTWRQDGFAFAAASDLNAAELAAFARRLKGGPRD